MEIQVPVIIEDQLTQQTKGIEDRFEKITIKDEYFLDGPISNRVAVLDFDDQGKLIEGVKLRPAEGKKKANYGDFDGVYVHDNAFVQVNVLGIVYRTLHMFEEDDTLGRQVEWAFNSPQLLVVPRAGEWDNAFYQRDSHSLQFFYFPSKKKQGKTIYTSLSHDIVAHETGHAILDGIAPDLYNAVTPQSLALHEAVADLTALIMSFRSRTLRLTVLEQTNGHIESTTAFSTIANEFGNDANARPLRNLNNDLKLSDVSRTSPHQLSEVLTGALYAVMIKIFEKDLGKQMIKEQQTRLQASGFALYTGGEQFKRMVFRALDYLPPGDVTFADYGRAIIAADMTGHKDYEEERDWIADEFVNRGIVGNAKELNIPSLRPEEIALLDTALEKIDLNDLIESNWVAYDFVNKVRDILKIPHSLTFEIRDRLKIQKSYYQTEGKIIIKECLLKVAWNSIEPNPFDNSLPPQRSIPVGITLAIAWETKKVLSYLISDQSPEHTIDRDEMILEMKEKGLLHLTKEAFSLESTFPKSHLECQVSDGVMRLKNTANMLHINHQH